MFVSKVGDEHSVGAGVPTTPKVGVLVLTYNNGKTLQGCLNSLLNQSYSNLRIIIVDNASSDNSIEEIERIYPGEFEIIKSPKNMGTGSRNLGIARALGLGCEFIFLTDGDTEMDENLIGFLVAKQLEEPEIGIAGASCYEHNHGDSSPIVSVNPWTADIQIFRYVKEPSETMAVGSALVSKRVFSRIGFYNPAYFAYYEDADICARALRAGFKVAIVPNARYHHYPGTSVAQISGLRGLVSIRNRFIFMRSTQPPRRWLRFLIFQPFLVVRSTGFWLLSGQLKEMQMALVGYFSGLWYMLYGNEPKQMKRILGSLLQFQASLS